MGGLVRDGDSGVLIQRRDNARWEPPGGVVELDEAIEDAVRREIEDETGARVAVERLTGVYKNMSRGVVALVFRCRLLSEPRKSTEEPRGVQWARVEAVHERMTPAYAARVRDAPEDLVQVRSHDGANLLSADPQARLKV